MKAEALRAQGILKEVLKTEPDRRKILRTNFREELEWDFFTLPDGTKSGYLCDLSETGCQIRTIEALDPKKWIRLIVKNPRDNLHFSAVGKVIWTKNLVEPWDEKTVTLQRCGIEFVRPLNPHILRNLRSDTTLCGICGKANATIPDAHDGNRLYCVLCHLRNACRELINPADLSDDGSISL